MVIGGFQAKQGGGFQVCGKIRRKRVEVAAEGFHDGQDAFAIRGWDVGHGLPF
jgi:hypothetical protein